MSRIIYRILVLIICTLMSVSLIATRPLAPTSATQTRHAFESSLLEQALPTPTAPAPRPREATVIDRAADMIRSIPLAPKLPAAPDAAERAAQARSAAPIALTPIRIPGDGPWMPGTLVAQTERLDLYIGKRTFSAEQISAFAPAIEQVLRDNEARFGTTLDRRISIGFYRSGGGVDVRGLAFTDTGRAELYYRAGENLDRAAVVAAHELGHHLEASRYGEEVQSQADTILHEGMATWIAGDRWLALSGAATWKERTRQLRDAGIPLRLLTAERFGADNAYEMWASFVDFLAERHGWEQLDALYRSGRGRAPGSSDYLGVLDISLDDLADEWRTWVDE